MVDLTGKHIIVAGASSGIGRQTSITLSRLGAKVSCIARREEQLSETVNLLDGEGHDYFLSDLSKLEEIDSLIQEIVKKQGMIDGVVHTAGISIVSPLRQFTPEKMMKVFQINYFSFMEIIRQTAKKNRFRPEMSIVGISSTSSMRLDKSNTAYSASKAAINATVRNLAMELYSKGIRINAVAPAMVDTEMYRKALEGIEESLSEGLKSQYMGIIDPQSVSNLIAFLLSSASAYMTGLTIPIDGGIFSN